MTTKDPNHDARERGRHGSIEEEEMTSGDSPGSGHSGDLPGGGGKPDSIPPERLRELAEAAKAAAAAELDDEDLE